MAQLVEHSTGDQRFASSRLTPVGVTALCLYPLLSTGSTREDRKLS